MIKKFSKQFKILMVTAISCSLFVLVNFCAVNNANAASNDITYHGKVIKKYVVEFSGDQLETITFDNSCKFIPEHDLESSSNDYTRAGDSIKTEQLDGDYDFSTNNGKYIIRNFRFILDSEPNPDTPYDNAPHIEAFYRTDTPWWDQTGEDFTFYWKIEYYDTNANKWCTEYNDYDTGFTDYEDQSGHVDSTCMKLSCSARDNILKKVNTENLATGIRDGLIRITLNKLICDQV